MTKGILQEKAASVIPGLAWHMLSLESDVESDPPQKNQVVSRN
jgi:hypothetical protein